MRKLLICQYLRLSNDSKNSHPKANLGWLFLLFPPLFYIIGKTNDLERSTV